MRDIDHVTEIDRVLKGIATGRDGLVAESWRRCVESYGMDPTRAEPAHIVTEAELREHREQAERLISIARSGLQALFRQVAGQNYVLLLADAKGVTVDFFGDPRFEDELRGAGLYLGADWSEDLAGTCGVGSCIVTGAAVTIHQCDHFGLAHTPLSCTAAPIRDTSGALAAVLDISLLRSPTPKASQNLAMNLVRASARRVEMANLMAMTRRDWVLRFSASPEFLEVDPEAAVALDGSGRIIGLTGAARSFLAPNGSETPLIGQRIDALMDLAVDDLPELMRGRPTEERVLRLKDGRGLFGHAIAPHGAIGQARRRTGDLPGALSSFAGPDPALQRLLAEAARLAHTRIPLLICGETGTGKERLARALHVCGPGERPFRHVVCAGSGPAELDAALAGIGGDPATLFLDGPEDLAPDAQAMLVSVLTKRTNLRAISASRADLAGACEQGRFRRDLFFRLAGMTLRLPPLRHRQDFDWLLERLLSQRNAGERQLSPAARAELKARPWPGNIRELENALDVAIALVEGRVIDLCDLPPPALAAPVPPDPEDDLHAVLAASGWNMARAARRLGVNRSTVMRRVRKLGLAAPG
ncbi:sigma-54-dependent Fis family transcriptional regulator [Rhodovulum tesquicola]|uniref:sigma-54-dependent Fis family transcriptional regulator n=1 Tax=Rhodovulum tesquicola TaxID=540254 RepID=UPI002097AC26|nr:sigma-54-dependent Fis family transcriptional regulator [Rhodovulum tesquicola]MCO8146682.1 sigma-54-dependent Fis family transcriptional regulator [Rhodovulum tesquicola]